MEIALRRDDENVVRLNQEMVRDQLYWHVSITWKYLMQRRRDDAQMIDDDDGHAHVAWEILQKANIGVQASGRSAHTYDWKVPC
jgi:hypothetical protein